MECTQEILRRLIPGISTPPQGEFVEEGDMPSFPICCRLRTSMLARRKLAVLIVYFYQRTHHGSMLRAATYALCIM